MKKSVKTGLKIAAGGALAFAAVSEAVYEMVLNLRLANKMMSLFPLEDPKMMDVLLNNPVFTSANEWFDEKDLKDTIIYDEKGNEIIGNILKRPEESKKWAICVHGYNSSPRAQAAYAWHFYDQGYNIIFPHLRAHGSDTHRYCSMGYHDKDIVMTWINYLVGTYPDCEILLHGVSMGSATVMMVTGEEGLPENVKCAIADCGYTSAWDEFVYELKYAFHIPVYPLLPATNVISKLRGNFDFKKADAKSAVARSKTPTLFIHGTGDDFVPYYMLDEVYNACTAEKDKLDVEGAYHACSVAFDKDGYFRKTDEFTSKYI